MALTLIIIITILWLLRTAKADLFWLYLLQLKEYRLDRLKDHFKTAKGEKIIINPYLGIKFILFFALATLIIFPMPRIIMTLTIISLLIIYTTEIIDGVKKYLNNKIIKPRLTSKALILTGATSATNLMLITALFILDLNSLLLIFFLIALDILTPIKNLLIVLIMKPLNLMLKKNLFAKAKEKRHTLKNLLVIGITGSYGKTTTKEMLASILKEKFNIIATKEHENTEVAIAKFIIEKLNENHEIFICEMGAYKMGEIKTIAEITSPKVGIFVGANEQHLSLFGSMDNLISGEGGGELLESMGPKSLGIFNGNNIYTEELYKKTNIAKKLCKTEYSQKDGIGRNSDIWAKDIKSEKNSVTFTVCTKKNPLGKKFKLNFPGKYNIENLLLSVAIAEELGMSLKEISEAAEKIEPMAKTMVPSKNKKGINIIDSTYSANPTGVISHLEYLSLWSDAKKIVVMPCLIELGDKAKEIHKQIGANLGKVADLVIVTSAEHFNEIKIGFYETAKTTEKKKRILCIESPEEIIKILKENVKKEDVILFEGRLPETIIKNFL